MRSCSTCGRSSVKAASRSHSKIKTLRRQKVNLQTRHVDGLKVKMCTKCMRTETKNAAAA